MFYADKTRMIGPKLLALWVKGPTKKIQNWYLFLQPLKLATSNWVYNLNFGCSLLRKNFWDLWVWWKNYDDMLSRFHLIPEHHGQTDGQAELLYQYRASVCWCVVKTTLLGTCQTAHGWILSLRCISLLLSLRTDISAAVQRTVMKFGTTTELCLLRFFFSGFQMLGQEKGLGGPFLASQTPIFPIWRWISSGR